MFRADFFCTLLRLTCTWTVLALSSVVALADWTWPTNETAAVPADTRMVANFTFRNDGNNPVTVKDLKFACSCAEYTFDATTALPGKEGTLRIFLAPSKKKSLELIAFGPDKMTPTPLTIRISK